MPQHLHEEITDLLLNFTTHLGHNVLPLPHPTLHHVPSIVHMEITVQLPPKLTYTSTTLFPTHTLHTHALGHNLPRKEQIRLAPKL